MRSVCNKTNICSLYNFLRGNTGSFFPPHLCSHLRAYLYKEHCRRFQQCICHLFLFTSPCVKHHFPVFVRLYFVYLVFVCLYFVYLVFATLYFVFVCL